MSEYIRRKYSVYGQCQCYTCGRWKLWKETQAGHGFSGRGNAILFEEDIIRPQCFGCNCCSSGKLDIFTYKLREELGVERFEELWQLRNIQRKFTIPELMEMVEIYKQKIMEMK